MQGLRLKGIHWVIVGGESGPAARPMEPSWVKDVHDQCREACVPFFFKQWGGKNKKQAGRVLEGRTWNEVPAFVPPLHRAKATAASAGAAT
jgi:protein gp37